MKVALITVSGKVLGWENRADPPAAHTGWRRGAVAR